MDKMTLHSENSGRISRLRRDCTLSREDLRALLTTLTPEDAAFLYENARQVREIMAGLGFRRLSEMTGRTDCLRVRENLITDRAFRVDMRQILGEGPLPAAPEKDWYDFQLEKTPDMAVLLPAFAEGLARGALHAAEAMDIGNHGNIGNAGNIENKGNDGNAGNNENRSEERR